VQSLVDEGKLTPDEARGHPHRSLLLRVLLGRDDNEPDLDHVEGRLGDRYLLCSDGLTDMVDDAQIARALGAETIDMAATELVRLALEGGGYDNVTVAIGELVDASEDPDTHLSSADGQPQLVGAAAGGPRPRTGHEAGQAGPADDEPVAVDPEELRYAPRPPSGWRWIRRVTVVVVVLAILAAGAIAGYRWTQDQYFVAAHQGHVTIYRGVMADIPGVTLQHVEEATGIEMDSLPEFRRQQVDAGIEASSRADADRIVAELEESVPEPSPSPSPSDDKKDEKKDEKTA
jgi:protein phosphatase